MLFLSGSSVDGRSCDLSGQRGALTGGGPVWRLCASCGVPVLIFDLHLDPCAVQRRSGAGPLWGYPPIPPWHGFLPCQSCTRRPGPQVC